MPSVEVMAVAWHAAAEAASRAAEALNEGVRQEGPSSGVGLAQRDWVAEYERCEAMAELLGLLAVEAD